VFAPHRPVRGATGGYHRICKLAEPPFITISRPGQAQHQCRRAVRVEASVQPRAVSWLSGISPTARAVVGADAEEFSHREADWRYTDRQQVPHALATSMRKRLPPVLACAICRTVSFHRERVANGKRGEEVGRPDWLRAGRPNTRSSCPSRHFGRTSPQQERWRGCPRQGKQIGAFLRELPTRNAGTIRPAGQWGDGQRDELEENGPDRGQGAASEETETVLPGNCTTSQPSVVEVTGVCGGDWANSRRSLERVIFPADKEFAPRVRAARNLCCQPTYSARGLLTIHEASNRQRLHRRPRRQRRGKH
jgi:hypothetical protein